MILQTPCLKRERGFLHFGFSDEDENVEIQDTTPSDVRPQVAEGEWGVYGWCEMLRCKKTAVTDLQTNHFNEDFFPSIPE
jgi:hypothetical protein